MVTRIRRNRAAEPKNTDIINGEMKSIATLQERMAQDSAALKNKIVNLYGLMKAAGLSAHTVDGLIAELFRPTGRAVNVIDPKGFRKLVKDDKDFYSCISVSVTNAKKVLPEKQLTTITTTKEAALGEETVKVHRLSE